MLMFTIGYYKTNIMETLDHTSESASAAQEKEQKDLEQLLQTYPEFTQSVATLESKLAEAAEAFTMASEMRADEYSEDAMQEADTIQATGIKKLTEETEALKEEVADRILPLYPEDDNDKVTDIIDEAGRESIQKHGSQYGNRVRLDGVSNQLRERAIDESGEELTIQLLGPETQALKTALLTHTPEARMARLAMGPPFKGRAVLIGENIPQTLQGCIERLEEHIQQAPTLVDQTDSMLRLQSEWVSKITALRDYGPEAYTQATQGLQSDLRYSVIKQKITEVLGKPSREDDVIEPDTVEEPDQDIEHKLQSVRDEIAAMRAQPGAKDRTIYHKLMKKYYHPSDDSEQGKRIAQLINETFNK